MSTQDGEYRISRRLKDALVADLVFDDLDEEGGRWLRQPIGDEYEWTMDLGRQLGMTHTHGPGGIHDTLMLMIPEIDNMLRAWPPPQMPEALQPLTHEATKNLSAIELYATLLAGPGRWRRRTITCTIENLPRQLQPTLERELATELSRVFTKWVNWDIPRLKERRQELRKAAEEDAAAEASARASRSLRTRPTRKELEDRRGDPSGFFQPPGRT